MKSICLIILAVAILNCSAEEDSNSIVCRNVANGVFLADLYNCSHYITCWEEKAYPGTCPNDLYFSANSQKCDFLKNTQCTQQCTGQLSCFAYPNTCNKYVLCYATVPVIQQCADDLQYNPETDRCDYPQNVDCQANMCTAVNNPNDIVYLPSHASCSKYYICYNGQPVPFDCSSGLVFNPSINACDRKENSNCTISAKTRLVLPYSKAPPTRANIPCPKQGSHFYENENDRNSYYYCMNGNGVILTCSPGLIYDVEVQSCRDPKMVSR